MSYMLSLSPKREGIKTALDYDLLQIDRGFSHFSDVRAQKKIKHTPENKGKRNEEKKIDKKDKGKKVVGLRGLFLHRPKYP